MSLSIIRLIGISAAVLVVGCSSPDTPGAVEASNQNLDEGARRDAGLPSELDLNAPRMCTVTAYESALEPTKFAVGDFVVSAVNATTPSAIPLSKFVRLDADGQPTEARFAIYMRHSGATRTSMLTPYSPMPFASRDATSMTFASPAETPEDSSILKLSSTSSTSVKLDFVERVHGHAGRTMAIQCDSTQE